MLQISIEGITYYGSGSPAVAPINCTAGAITKWWPICSVDGTTANSDACVGFSWPKSIGSVYYIPSAASPSSVCSVGASSPLSMTTFDAGPSPSGGSGFSPSTFVPRAIFATTRSVCEYGNSTGPVIVNNATVGTLIRHWFTCYAAAATAVVNAAGAVAIREVIRGPAAVTFSGPTQAASLPPVAQFATANDGLACYIDAGSKALSCLQLFAAPPGARPIAAGYVSNPTHSALAAVPAAWSGAWAAGTAYTPGSLSMSDAMLCAMRDGDGVPDCFASTDITGGSLVTRMTAGSLLDPIGVVGGFPVPPAQPVVINSMWGSPAADTFCAMHIETANSLLQSDVQAAPASSLFQRIRCYGTQSPLQTMLPAVVGMPRPLSRPWVARVTGGGGGMAAVMTRAGINATTEKGIRQAWVWGRGALLSDLQAALPSLATLASQAALGINTTSIHVGSFLLTRAASSASALACGLAVRLNADGVTCDGTVYNGSVSSKVTFSDVTQCDATVECEAPLGTAIGSTALTALRAFPARSMCAGIGIVCAARATADSMVCAFDSAHASPAPRFSPTASSGTGGWVLANATGRFSSLTCGRGFVCGYEQINGTWACLGNATIAASIAVPTGLEPLGSLSAGSAHVCGLRLPAANASTGRAVCWGSAQSQSAIDVPANLANLNFTNIVAMRSSSCGVTTAGLIRCWGALAARPGFLGFVPQKPGSFSFANLINTRVWNVSSTGNDALCSATRVCKTLAAAVALCPGLYCTINVLDDTNSAPVSIPVASASMSIVGILSSAGMRPTVSVSVSSNPTALLSVAAQGVTIRDLQLAAGGATVFATSATSFASGECNQAIRITGRYATMSSVSLKSMLCRTNLIATSGRVIASASTSASTGAYDLALRNIEIAADAGAPVYIAARGHERVAVSDITVLRTPDAASRLPAAFCSAAVTATRLQLDASRINVAGFTAGTAVDGGRTCGSVFGVLVDGSTTRGAAVPAVNLIDINATSIGNSSIFGAFACIKMSNYILTPAAVLLQNVRVFNATALSGALLYTAAFFSSLSSPAPLTSTISVTLTDVALDTAVGSGTSVAFLSGLTTLTATRLNITNVTSDGPDALYIEGSFTRVSLFDSSVARSTARMWPLLRCLCYDVTMTGVVATDLVVSDGSVSGLSPPAAVLTQGTGTVSLTRVTVDGLQLPQSMSSGAAVHAWYHSGSPSSVRNGAHFRLIGADALRLLRVQMTPFASAADAANAAFLGIYRAYDVAIPASSMTLTTTAAPSAYSVPLLRAMGCYGVFSVTLPPVAARQFLGAVVFVDAVPGDPLPSSLSLSGVLATEVQCVSSQSGCAVHVAAAGAVTLTNVDVANTSPARNGGAVFVAASGGAIVSIGSIRVVNASATGMGGAVYVETNNGTLIVSGPVYVKGTSAVGSGGAIYATANSSAFTSSIDGERRICLAPATHSCVVWYVRARACF